MADLPANIKSEAEELANVPKVPIQQYMGGGTWERCHICGQLYSTHDMKSYDGNRRGCPTCHPAR